MSTLASSTTASIDPKADAALPAETETAHQIGIGPAEAGSESVELSAKVTADGGVIQRPIAWKLHRMGGENVFAGNFPTITIPTEPGDYVVEATYGSVHAAQSVTILERQHVAMTLVLNVGGIRVLSLLSGIGLPATRPLTTIYAASGPDEGKLVTISEEPGEIMRLAAGHYRVESRFVVGNASATAEVTVKAGLLSSVEIDYRAGIAHLAAELRGAVPVDWTISDDEGHEFEANGDGDVVLLPGRYVAHARFGDESRTVSFTVEAGKRIEVVAR